MSNDACVAHDRSRCSVLIVEPERDLRETLGELLGGWGYAAAMAASGRDALELARACSPAVVLTELLLGDLHLEDLLGELRRSSSLHAPTFVVLTSWCRWEDRLRAGRAGVDRFLSKPAEPRQLHQLLLDVA